MWKGMEPMFFTSPLPPILVLKATSKQSLLKIFIACQEDRQGATWPCVPGGNAGFKAPRMEMLPPLCLVERAISADMFIGVKNIII